MSSIFYSSICSGSERRLHILKGPKSKLLKALSPISAGYIILLIYNLKSAHCKKVHIAVRISFSNRYMASVNGNGGPSFSSDGAS